MVKVQVPVVVGVQELGYLKYLGLHDSLQQTSVNPPWVFKISNVGGDDGATRRSRNNTADPKASSAVPVGIATIAGALTGGETSPVDAGIEKC